MLFPLVTFHRFAALVLVAASAAFAACTAEVTPGGGTGEGSPPAGSSSATPIPAPTGSSPATSDGGGTDAGPDAAPANVSLQITGAGYRNTTAAGGGFVYAVDFTLRNTSSTDVTSLDTMTFDLGGQNQVSLTKPVCKGTFGIAAGATKLIETQVVVSNAGTLSNFSFICPGSQSFGGATGKAPATATFADPIAVTTGGKTSDGGSFSASGSAARTN